MKSKASKDLIKLNPLDIRLFCSCVLVIFAYIYAYRIQYAPPELYLFSISLIYISAPPKFIIHPQNFLFGYHILWYTIPLIYAPRYQFNNFTTYEEVIAFCMFITTYIVSFITLHFTCSLKKTKPFRINLFKELKNIPLFWIHIFSISFTIIICLLILNKHGGFSTISKLHFSREGTGVYNILLLFSSGIALSTASYYISIKKNILLVLFYFLFVAFLLLFLQHRSRLLFFILLLFIWKSMYLKFKIRNVVYIASFIFSSFILGSMIRSSDQFTSIEQGLKFTLNYFDVYEVFLLVLRDFPPSFSFQTIFMSFNKFLTPFGITEGVEYNMSSWLTKIYFSNSGVGYRTTIQWPVETDLYLSMYYVFGLPLIVLYFTIIGKMYRLAMKTKSLGAMYVSLVLMMNIMGHMRGALIAWRDLYLIPILIVSYYILNRFKFRV